jgi:phosphopantothenoylcysteine decarboxylase/phosphopantothenate--cysteine ligase
MQNPDSIPLLQGKRILLGVTGSIAAFKAADLASKLTQAGALVDVILTEAGERFIAPLTFQALTGGRAYVQEDLWGDEAHILHVGLAEAADILVIAPATADTLAQLTHGRADTLLTLTALAARCPMIVAPAMDSGMYDAPATQENLQTLIGRGVVQVGPVDGRMASGLVGLGRMVEPAELIGHVRLVLARSGALQGRKIVVTAGGTQEPIDPVRSLTNRSSGKQGYALAQAALDHGAAVTLVSASTDLSPPVGAGVVEVRTAEEMKDATLAAIEEADVLLMAAAVADFKPAGSEKEKIKRRKGVPDLKLEPTDDILADVAKHRNQSGYPAVVVGFAAESQDLEQNARAKLEEKNLSLIVANDITASDAGFSVDTNQVTLISSDEEPEVLPLMSKAQVAEVVLDRVAHLLTG